MKRRSSPKTKLSLSAYARHGKTPYRYAHQRTNADGVVLSIPRRPAGNKAEKYRPGTRT